MTVRAKFTCSHKEDSTDDAGGGRVSLSPVINGSDENKNFYRLTPGGSISLSTINARAYDEFEVGKSYFVDFSLATA
jgi:hypothetical protein